MTVTTVPVESSIKEHLDAQIEEHTLTCCSGSNHSKWLNVYPNKPFPSLGEQFDTRPLNELCYMRRAYYAYAKAISILHGASQPFVDVPELSDALHVLTTCFNLNIETVNDHVIIENTKTDLKEMDRLTAKVIQLITDNDLAIDFTKANTIAHAYIY